MRRLAGLAAVLATAAVLAACADEQQNGSPTAPSMLNARPAACKFTDVQKAVDDYFVKGTAIDAEVTDSVKSMSTFYGASNTSETARVGYWVMDKISSTSGTPSQGATLTVLLFRCMQTGGAITDETALTTALTAALSTNGAYAVRSRTSTDAAVISSRPDPLDATASRWTLEPSGNNTWAGIVTTPNVTLSGLSDDLFLAYGSPGNATNFTATGDQLQVGVFNWETIPAVYFDPGVVVGECTRPSSFMQHYPAGDSRAEVGGFTPPSCAAETALLPAFERSQSLYARLFRLVAPAPLQAAALGSTGTGTTKNTLSPFGVINPVQVKTLFIQGLSTKGYTAYKYISPVLSIQARSTGGLPFKQNVVLAWIEAVNNNGVGGIVCNNWAYSDNNGVITFPTAYITKAGGYTITIKNNGTATVPGGGGASNTPNVPADPNFPSGQVQVKNGTYNGTLGCNVYNPQTNTFTEVIPVP